MHVGDIETFPDARADKEQVLKVAEEVMEVFAAWEDWKDAELESGFFAARNAECPEYGHLLEECADVMQAVANLLAALRVDDFSGCVRACAERNRKRGRL